MEVTQAVRPEVKSRQEKVSQQPNCVMEVEEKKSDFVLKA
jgi:hypothetical protein